MTPDGRIKALEQDRAHLVAEVERLEANGYVDTAAAVLRDIAHLDKLITLDKQRIKAKEKHND